jgi:hypothetical protein
LLGTWRCRPDPSCVHRGGPPGRRLHLCCRPSKRQGVTAVPWISAPLAPRHNPAHPPRPRPENRSCLHRTGLSDRRVRWLMRRLARLGRKGTMAQSTLTVRTLCLATIAFILACGHAARAVGQQKPTNDKAAPRTIPSQNRAIRVIPAGSGHSTIATYTAGNAGTASRSGGSRVATFTSKSSSNNAIATFSGDRIVRQTASSSPGRRPHVTPKRTGIASTFARTGEAPIISVRRPGEPEPSIAITEEPAPEPVQVAVVTPAPAPTSAPMPTSGAPAIAMTDARPPVRNAFGGLNAPGVEPRRTPPILSIQASAAR